MCYDMVYSVASEAARLVLYCGILSVREEEKGWAAAKFCFGYVLASYKTDFSIADWMHYLDCKVLSGR